MIWAPAGHGVHVVTPDGKTVAVGDRSGDVHLVLRHRTRVRDRFAGSLDRTSPVTKFMYLKIRP